MIAKIEAHLEAAAALIEDVPLLEHIAGEILACYARGGCVYLLGNGGSAADAQHIAAELLGRFKLDRRALPAVALTTDTSTLTAVANDIGADAIFARQVEGLVTDKDIVWALSVSGTSPNVLAAVRAAREKGATVIGFTSQRGTELAALCTHCLMAAHTDSDRTQEVHLLAYHLICEKVEAAAAAEEDS